jgi:hypothetical protein
MTFKAGYIDEEEAYRLIAQAFSSKQFPKVSQLDEGLVHQDQAARERVEVRLPIRDQDGKAALQPATADKKDAQPDQGAAASAAKEFVRSARFSVPDAPRHVYPFDNECCEVWNGIAEEAEMTAAKRALLDGKGGEGARAAVREAQDNVEKLALEMSQLAKDMSAPVGRAEKEVMRERVGSAMDKAIDWISGQGPGISGGKIRSRVEGAMKRQLRNAGVKAALEEMLKVRPADYPGQRAAAVKAAQVAMRAEADRAEEAGVVCGQAYAVFLACDLQLGAVVDSGWGDRCEAGMKVAERLIVRARSAGEKTPDFAVMKPDVQRAVKEAHEAHLSSQVDLQWSSFLP